MKQGRKISGGKYHTLRKRRKFEHAGESRKTILGERKVKVLRTRGGHDKKVLLKDNTANVLVDKKVKPAKIINVIETPQNKFFARQNILFKGSVIETSLGKARITNRPSQEGQVNAVLIK